MGSRQVLANSEMAENRTNLIVGLRFRGLRGPVDQPGIQRVRAGRRSPAWQVVFDPECGKALALLRRAAGSNPARSTTHMSWARGSSRLRGAWKIRCYWFSGGCFKKGFQERVFREAVSETGFQRPDFQEAIPRRRFLRRDSSNWIQMACPLISLG